MTVLCGFVLVHPEDVGMLVPAKKLYLDVTAQDSESLFLTYPGLVGSWGQSVRSAMIWLQCTVDGVKVLAQRSNSGRLVVLGLEPQPSTR